MATDSKTSYAVYLGAWTDWSKGRVLGATLTLNRQDGNLLIAFIAFFVALVGTRFWRLGCLILHYVYSKDGPSDGVHHQRQAFLRNAPNPESGLWTLTDMGFSWRTNAKQVWVRLLPLFGLAVSCFVGFALAGGFSSRVAAVVNSEVLLSAANCSFIANDNNMSTFGNANGPWVAGTMTAAETYARQCYTSGPVGATVPVGATGAVGAICGTYTKKTLVPAVVDTNASCPFDTTVCKGTTRNLLIDTGLLDTHDDFGRNSPPDQRIQFRRTVHCAPLATERYRVRTYDEAANETYITYYYGPMENVNGTTMNYTTRFLNNIYPNIEELTHAGQDTVHDFSVRTHFASHRNGSIDTNQSSFFPIPELTPENATLSIFFLTSGRILFTQPSNDNWYGGTTNTTQVHKLRVSSWGNATFFRQSEPGSPLACKELEQYCFTGVSRQRKCTALQGRQNAVNALFDLFDTRDLGWAYFLFYTTFADAIAISDPLIMLGSHVLTARDKLNEIILGPLPDNQWQIEVQHWHATAMAHLQAMFLASPVGFMEPKYSKVRWYPTTAAANETCANQKIIAEGFVSISIFGLSCIFVTGCLIILLSYVFGPALSLCLGRVGRYQYAKLEWSNTEAFQLQRLAHEGVGMKNTWSRATKSIPVTRPGDILAVMDIANPKHPKLRIYEQPVSNSEQPDQQSDEGHEPKTLDSDDLSVHDPGKSHRQIGKGCMTQASETERRKATGGRGAKRKTMPLASTTVLGVVQTAPPLAVRAEAKHEPSRALRQQRTEHSSAA